jgi:hypothetical protein
MPRWFELKTALMKGFGLWPTSYLLRWSPSWKNPLKFDLLEVMKCEADGGVVTFKSAQSLRAAPHLGHRIVNPRCYTLWELLQVQLRLIR